MWCNHVIRYLRYVLRFDLHNIVWDPDVAEFRMVWSLIRLVLSPVTGWYGVQLQDFRYGIELSFWMWNLGKYLPGSVFDGVRCTHMSLSCGWQGGPHEHRPHHPQQQDSQPTQGLLQQFGGRRCPQVPHTTLPPSVFQFRFSTLPTCRATLVPT